ncbi:thermonuclease family protein [Fodinicurvata sediminis]|uniref:thermonuclease family protein n=1 Tax=Fodinicurvata sediminis TaxID=1121832 RepID=UPI0003B7A53C|nr:thermonuclease family protein [Fodinicurvata sediminis]
MKSLTRIHGYEMVFPYVFYSFLVLLLLATTTLQAGTWEALAETRTKMQSDFTLELASGDSVLLAGVLPPQTVLEPGAEMTALQEEALAFLSRATKGKSLNLISTEITHDRHGRRLAQVFQAGTPELWLQGHLVREGLAIVHGGPARRTMQTDLLALENQARLAKRGLWRLAELQPLSPHRANEAIGRWRLIEGQVQDTAAIRGRGYINFGADWREDFTIYLNPERLAEFEETSGPLDRLQGRRLRVRGWLVSYNGPMIELSYPEQIEVLE